MAVFDRRHLMMRWRACRPLTSSDSERAVYQQRREHPPSIADRRDRLVADWLPVYHRASARTATESIRDHQPPVVALEELLAVFRADVLSVGARVRAALDRWGCGCRRRGRRRGWRCGWRGSERVGRRGTRGRGCSRAFATLPAAERERHSDERDKTECAAGDDPRTRKRCQALGDRERVRVQHGGRPSGVRTLRAGRGRRRSMSGGWRRWPLLELGKRRWLRHDWRRGARLRGNHERLILERKIQRVAVVLAVVAHACQCISIAARGPSSSVMAQFRSARPGGAREDAAFARATLLVMRGAFTCRRRKGIRNDPPLAACRANAARHPCRRPLPVLCTGAWYRRNALLARDSAVRCKSRPRVYWYLRQRGLR